jgi:hypothetical protein
VALEAILCIAFMFGVLYCMWGASIVIYNQTKLNTATQFATHAALITYDRATFRGQGGNETANVNPQTFATNVADSVFCANLRGLAQDQSGTGNAIDCPTSPPAIPGQGFDIDVHIICAPNALSIAQANAANCTAGDSDPAAGEQADQVTEVQTTSGLPDTTFWLLAPLSQKNFQTTAADQQSVQLGSHAQAFSFGPYACFNQSTGAEIC